MKKSDTGSAGTALGVSEKKKGKWWNGQFGQGKISQEEMIRDI